MKNPILGKDPKNAFGAIPFEELTVAHIEEAIQKGLDAENEAISGIVSNSDAPTFENTIVALERSGYALEEATAILFNLLDAETSQELDDLSEKMSPILSEHSNDITMNERLFERVKAVYDHREEQKLQDKEQVMLLQNTYNGFVRNGALLDNAQKSLLRKIDAELSLLRLQFSQNKLKELNSFALNVTNDSVLKSMPENVVENAKEEAQRRGETGWTFTLQAPSYIAMMKYCEDRSLRETIYKAYNSLGTHENEYNNNGIVKKLVNLRLQKAQLLGFETYAEYVLQQRMAEKTATVQQFITHLLEVYLPYARKEVAEIQKFAEISETISFELMPWDFSYYANKLQKQKFDFDQEQLRPYLELGKVKDGVFELATRLYGIRFIPNKDIQGYHKEVEVYEVYDKDGSFLALLYCDFHPRTNKKSGAWMTNYEEQWIDEKGVEHRPQVSIAMNLSRATVDKPSLLTLDEVETFLHEFGHALHSILARTRYKSLSGTNVYWDFVELPSQLMENYSTEKEFLQTFAFHYKTGEPLPAFLIDRVVNSRNFNVAYSCVRQLSFCLLDMAYYTLEHPLDTEVESFEKQIWRPISLLPQITGMCMTTQFSHIMTDGYAAGYYSYKWAEVLDADSFALFKEHGIFDKHTAARFRKEILSKGGTEFPMDLYVKFRGRKPSIDALLKRNEILQER